MPREPHIRIFFSIYRKTVLTSLDFTLAYFPTTKRTTLMWQKILSFDNYILGEEEVVVGVKKEIDTSDARATPQSRDNDGRSKTDEF